MSKIPRWLPVGDRGAVLRDAAGLVYGSVARHPQAPALWVGTALGVKFEPSGGGGEIRLATAREGATHVTDSKERAMEIVVSMLQSAGRL